MFNFAMHYWDATWTLSNEIAVIQPPVDMSESRPAAGDLRMEEEVLIAVGDCPVQSDQSLHTAGDSSLLTTTTSRKKQENAGFKRGAI